MNPSHPVHNPFTPLLWLLLAIIAFGACTPQRQLIYLQDKQALGDELDVKFPIYRIKPNDILHVRVITADGEGGDLFESDVTRRTTGGAGGFGQSGMFLYGYTVNEDGFVHLPLVGPVQVAGLTYDEARERIQQLVDEYLVGATVSLRHVNFSVTMLGEVRSAGNYYVYEHEFTIMNAIAMAGDLTPYGNRNVHIIRRDAEGVTFHRLDITDRKAVNSELYFLQPNDIVYVEPLLPERLRFATQPFSLVATVISTGLLVFSLFW